MKKGLLITMCLIGFQGFSKEVPGPSVLFSISEKILAQAQQLFSEDKPAAKQIKVKPVIKVKTKVPLKVVEPTAQEKPVQQPAVKIKRDGMWITTEQ